MITEARQVWRGVQHKIQTQLPVIRQWWCLTGRVAEPLLCPLWGVVTRDCSAQPTGNNSLMVEEHLVRRMLWVQTVFPDRCWRTVQLSWLGSSQRFSTSPWVRPSSLPAWSLNDYCLVVLTPIIMKCFEKLVWTHIASSLHPSFDPHQYAYRASKSTEDAIVTALQAALSHLEQQGSYTQLLFVDFSSAFNRILKHE